MKTLKECCGDGCGTSCAGSGFATPMNTMGMGGVDPFGADIMPVQKKKKHKMRSLKDILKKKLGQKPVDWKNKINPNTI